MIFPRRPGERAGRPTASVLLLVLIVIAFLTLASMSTFDRMFAEHQGAGAFGRRLQTRAFAESGIEYAKFLLAQDPTVTQQEGGLYDNPTRMQAVVVADSDLAALRGRFTLLAPAMSSDGYWDSIRYGLQNESARLNLNAVLLADQLEENASRGMLMELTGMTESIADAILDWIDSDSQPRPLGAESDYYSTLDPPYQPTNGPLETVEQLLLVRDVTPELLYGAPNWAGHFTIHSAERNARADGSPLINLNQQNLRELHRQLRDAIDEKSANFIIAYRQGGAYQGDEAGTAAGSITLDFNRAGSTTIGSLFDLIGVKTQLSADGEDSQQQIVAEAFPAEQSWFRSELPKLLTNVTTTDAPLIPGRLNINQAPRPLLLGLPGISLGAVNEIIASRDLEVQPERPERASGAWPLVAGILELDEMKRLWPLVTGGGDVYRVESVGFFEADGPTARLEVVLDATQSVPAVRQWKDLREQQLPYTREILGVEPAPDG